MLNPPDRRSSHHQRLIAPAVSDRVCSSPSIAVVAFVLWVAAAAVSWFMWSLSRDLPDRQSLRSIGDMAQATTLFDAHDQPAFTIFKEQRIEVPLAEDVAAT